MRVLVCLSSLPRNFDVFVTSFKKRVLKHIPYPVDFVGHFPEKPSNKLMEELLEGMNCRLIKVEDDPEFTWELEYDRNLIPNQEILGNLLQWHSMRECAKLKRELESSIGTPYHLVIWSRPDLFFFNDVKIDFAGDLDKLYVPGVDGHHGLNDRFCYGGSDVMDLRMDILAYFLNVWYAKYHDYKSLLNKRGNWWNSYYCWNPEMVYKRLLIDKGIPFEITSIVIGKIRSKKIGLSDSSLFISSPDFDINVDLRDLQKMRKRLKAIKRKAFEDERTKLLELEDVIRSFRN